MIHVSGMTESVSLISAYLRDLSDVWMFSRLFVRANTPLPFALLKNASLVYINKGLGRKSMVQPLLIINLDVWKPSD